MDSEASTKSGTTKVHSMAVTGFTKDSADSYDSSRPDYTEDTINEILKRSPLLNSESAANILYDILELGAGTGKFTRALYPKLKQPVKYLATDPSEGFLNVLQQHCPGVETAVSAANSLNLPEHSIRVIIAAQCFHWFATKEVLREIYRVLTPDGILVLVWNQCDERIPWIHETRKLLNEYYVDDIPRAVTGSWKTAFQSFPDFRQQFFVEPPGPVLKGTTETIVNYHLTISVIASLPDSEKQEAKQKFEGLMHKWFPNPTKKVEYSFQTLLYGFVKQ